MKWTNCNWPKRCCKVVIAVHESWEKVYKRSTFVIKRKNMHFSNKMRHFREKNTRLPWIHNNVITNARKYENHPFQILTGKTFNNVNTSERSVSSICYRCKNVFLYIRFSCRNDFKLQINCLLSLILRILTLYSTQALFGVIWTPISFWHSQHEMRKCRWNGSKNLLGKKLRF